MLCAMQLLHSLYDEQVGCYSADVGSHGDEHTAELLYVRFACSIVYRCGTLGEHGGHDDVCRSRHRSLVEKHVGAFQSVGLYLEGVGPFAVYEFRPELLESEEVRVQPATAYLVSARLCHHRLAEAREQRTDHKHASPERSAFPDEFLSVEIAQVYVLRAERVFVLAHTVHFHAYILEQENKVVHV